MHGSRFSDDAACLCKKFFLYIFLPVTSKATNAFIGELMMGKKALDTLSSKYVRHIIDLKLYFSSLTELFLRKLNPKLQIVHSLISLF